MVELYIVVSVVVGIWWELETGAGHDPALRRMPRMVVYALAWPALLAISAWFFFSLDPEDTFW